MLTSQLWADGKLEYLNIKVSGGGKDGENSVIEAKDDFCRLPHLPIQKKRLRVIF